MEALFFEIGIILIIAAFFSLVVFRFRQPLILGYLITGILVGPGVFALTSNAAVFEVMSQIGVAFLLFTVGLGLNWRSFKDVGGIAFATGVGQVLFTSVIGLFIGLLLGFGLTSSLYLAIAFSFSSTIIIIKLLMDKEDLDTLYGRISIGILLVQDFIAMLLLLGLAAVTSGATIEQAFISVMVKSLLLIPVLWFISARIIPKLLAYVARSQELLLIFSIAWCFLIAGILVFFGFGMEIGALIAGITLSGTVYHREINARVRPLRDFFLIIFFIVLGTRLGFDQIGSLVIPTIVFSVFILIGHPLIVLFIMRALGYHPRTGFLAGTTMAQISEFSFILIAAGIVAGHIDNRLLALSTSVGLITMAVSSYLIEHNEKIYAALSPLLRKLEPKITLGIERKKAYPTVQVLLFGFHPIGEILLKTVQELKQSYLVVDFDPRVIQQLTQMNIPNLYGDVGDELMLEQIDSHKTKLIISTVPDVTVSSSLLMFLKSKKYAGVAIVSAHNETEANVCYDLGASYVIIPNFLSGEKFAEILKGNRTRKQAWASAYKNIPRIV